MIKSIITVWCSYDVSEMLIPKVIGKVIRGFLSVTRINRLLQEGHRYHGYEV